MKKCMPITAKLNKMQKNYAGSSGPNVAPDGDKIQSPAKKKSCGSGKKMY